MENIVTIEEFAKMANVSHQAIYDLILKERLPSVRIVGKKVINLDDKRIKEYLSDKGIS